MKKNFLKAILSIFTVFVLSFCSIMSSSAVHMVNVLSDENFAKAQEFIEADDRAGLYDFLYEIIEYPEQDHYFIWFTTNFTGSYALNDENYNLVLKHYVMPIDIDNPEPPLAPAPPTVGDVNFDGKISLFDIIMVNRIVTGAMTVQNIDQAMAADVDGSNVIDLNDVNLIMQYVLEIIDYFPADADSNT